MRHLSADEVVALALRRRICSICTQRPAGSESMPATEARSCETECPIFLNLHALERAARACDARPGALEAAILKHVCAQCHARPTAGEYCAEMLARTCPVSRYAGVISAIIEDLMKSNGHPAAA